MAHYADDAAQRLRVCHRGIDGNAAALGRPADDDPTRIADSPHLRVYESVHSSSHLQKAPEIDVVLAGASLIRQVVEPRVEFDAPPLELFPLPHHPVLEAGLFLLRSSWQNHTHGSFRNTKVVREILVRRALGTETMQVDEAPFWRHTTAGTAPWVEHNGLSEDRFLALLCADFQIPPIDAAADWLEFVAVADNLVASPAHGCQRMQLIHGPILPPADPGWRLSARTCVAVVAANVGDFLLPLGVHVADALGLPDARGTRSTA
mmetsp:Transcript_33744/g.73856  ORF Transcript_33744/g.73856 Transcript_33744/m.73856 type:complete len:263 (+) Transcript_33744:551-1339(+)